MKIITKSKTTDAMKTVIEEKLSFVRDYSLETFETLKVTISKEGELQKISLGCNYMKKDIYISDKGPDFYELLDKLKDVLKAQMVKNKEIIHSRQGKDKKLGAIDTRDEKLISNVLGEEYGLESHTLYNPLAKVKVFNLKPMFIKEAIEHLEMLGHDFFVFLNCESNNQEVLYKRKDGRYGLITTELL